MSGYRHSQELQYWIDTAPAAIVPTHGVRLDVAPDQSNCRCHRCKAGDTSAGKHPKRKWKDLDNGLHPNVLCTYIKAWLDDETSVGWALATGRAALAVLDVDPRNDGLDTLRGLLSDHGSLPLTPHDETGGGGYHWYFRWHHHVANRSTVTLGPGVELLAGNHLVQIAPSIHYTGHAYRWLKTPWETEFAAPPEWIAEKLKAAEAPPISAHEIRYAEMLRNATGERRIDRARAYLARTPVAIQGEHGWQHTNAVIVRVTRGFALTADEACELIGEWNAGCMPPWSNAQIRAKVQWALQQSSDTGFLLGEDRRHEERVIKVKVKPRNRVAELLAPTPVGIPTPAQEPIEPTIDDEIAQPRSSEWDKYYEDGWDVVDADASIGGPTCSEIEKIRLKEIAAKKAVISAADEIERMRFTAFPCPRARTIITERTDAKTEEKSFCLIQPRCEAWSCPACGHLHRGEWGVNYQCRIGSLYATPVVWAIEAPTEQQNTITARIRRNKGEYFFVDTKEPGVRLIVASVPFAGASEVAKQAAVDMLTACINQFTGQRKPGGSSRGWALPKRDKSKHDYKLLAVVSDSLDDDATDARLEKERVHLEPCEIPSAHRWRIVRYRQIKLGKRSKSARERVLKRLLDIPLHKVRFGRNYRPDPGEFDDYERPEPALYDQPCNNLSDPGWSNKAEMEPEFAF